MVPWWYMISAQPQNGAFCKAKLALLQQQRLILVARKWRRSVRWRARCGFSRQVPMACLKCLASVGVLSRRHQPLRCRNRWRAMCRASSGSPMGMESLWSRTGSRSCSTAANVPVAADGQWRRKAPPFVPRTLRALPARIAGARRTILGSTTHLLRGGGVGPRTTCVANIESRSRG